MLIIISHDFGGEDYSYSNINSSIVLHDSMIQFLDIYIYTYENQYLLNCVYIYNIVLMGHHAFLISRGSYEYV